MESKKKSDFIRIFVELGKGGRGCVDTADNVSSITKNRIMLIVVCFK